MRREPNNILLIRPSALGDVARSVHVLVTLRRRWPGARIDWLVQRGFEGIVECHPDLTGVVPFDRGGIAAALSRGDPRPLAGLFTRLRRGRYDLVVDAQGLMRSAALGLASGAPRKVGYRDAREGAPALYTERAHAPADRHAVDRMHLLAAAAVGSPPDALGPPELRLHPDPAEVSRVRSRFGSPIVFAATSRWPAKRWPADRWAALATSLIEGASAAEAGPIVLVGGPGERDQCRPLIRVARREAGRGSPRVVDLVGETSVAGLLGVIAASRLVVANDSAAAHIAVGCDRPLVAIYGPTRTDLVGPYGRGADVIQHATPAERSARPGAHKDARSSAVIERVTTEEVAAACRSRLLPSTAG